MEAERENTASEADRPADVKGSAAGVSGTGEEERALRYRLRKTRERRRRQLPLEEELTSIYIADDPNGTAPDVPAGPLPLPPGVPSPGR